MVTDPIADLLARIKNAAQAGHPSVVLPFSKIKLEIANALVRAGYAKSAATVDADGFKSLEIFVSPKLNHAERVSRVSRRIYSGIKELKPVRQGYGTAILSTTKGILTDKEARKQGLGGEVLLKIW